MRRNDNEKWLSGSAIMSRVAKCAAMLSVLGFVAAAGTPAKAADAKMKHPDFTGVWLGFAALPAGRLGPKRPELSAKGEAMIKTFQDKYGKDAPESGAYCVPDGMPAMMTGLAGYPLQIVQRHDLMVMTSEDEMQLRRIFLDGRKQPKGYPPTRAGFSRGHWDGNTLVIDSTDFLDWPSQRWPRSHEAHMVERISMTKRDKIDVKNTPFIIEKPVNDDVMVDEITVYDPVFTKPAKITVYYQPVPYDDFLEYDCPRSLWQNALDAHLAKKKAGKN
ncbi:MAG TPA: hypothetical protein VKA19_07760 [Alphaproteobacteria bacterium]|nr:hypothetical protein [Alphaproteobacteria bacterium]